MRVSSSAIMVGLAIAVASMIAGDVLGELAGLPVSTLVIALASLSLLAVAARATDRTGTAAITVACTLGLTLYMATRIALWMPLASGFYRPIQIKSLPFNVLLDVFLGVLVAIPIAFIARRVRGILLPFAIALAVCTTILASLGLRSLSRPAPDELAARCTSATIQPGGHAKAGPLIIDYDNTPETDIQPLRCVIRANGRAIEFFERYMCSEITVRTQADGTLVLLYGREDMPIAILAPVAGDGIPTLVDMKELVRRMGTPRGWVVGGLVSLVLACVAIARALRTRSRKIEGIEASHEGAGWVHVAGAPPRFAPDLATAAPGPVVIFDDATNPPTYRDDGAAKIFKTKHGTLATLRDEQLTHVASWACVAIATLVIGFVPLLVARLNGLL